MQGQARFPRCGRVRLRRRLLVPDRSRRRFVARHDLSLLSEALNIGAAENLSSNGIATEVDGLAPSLPPQTKVKFPA